MVENGRDPRPQEQNPVGRLQRARPGLPESPGVPVAEDDAARLAGRYAIEDPAHARFAIQPENRLGSPRVGVRIAPDQDPVDEVVDALPGLVHAEVDRRPARCALETRQLPEVLVRHPWAADGG